MCEAKLMMHARTDDVIHIPERDHLTRSRIKVVTWGVCGFQNDVEMVKTLIRHGARPHLHTKSNRQQPHSGYTCTESMVACC